MAEIFQVATGGDQSNSLNSGTFFYISGPPQHNNISSLQKQTFTKSLGGPWLRHCHRRRGHDEQKERLGLQIYRKFARQCVNCDVTSLLLRVPVT